tara:strand:- start:43 stop:207 length:165 start_codon:yes stop_codon:yes gene_type:complete
MTEEMEKMREALKRYQKTQSAVGRRIFELGINQTAQEQGAARMIWFNIKQAFER